MIVLLSVILYSYPFLLLYPSGKPKRCLGTVKDLTEWKIRSGILIVNMRLHLPTWGYKLCQGDTSKQVFFVTIEVVSLRRLKIRCHPYVWPFSCPRRGGRRPSEPRQRAGHPSATINVGREYCSRRLSRKWAQVNVCWSGITLLRPKFGEPLTIPFLIVKRRYIDM